MHDGTDASAGLRSSCTGLPVQLAAIRAASLSMGAAVAALQPALSRNRQSPHPASPPAHSRLMKMQFRNAKTIHAALHENFSI
jgi:hypothetical protein